MKIKTLEELEDSLNKHLAWRKKEMMTLKLLIESGDEARITLIRAGIALLCAHFEGFIRLKDLLEMRQTIIYYLFPIRILFIKNFNLFFLL